MEGSGLNKKTLREQVVDILRERMLGGALKPGERLVETQISKELRISRGPIREALRQLAEEGLLVCETHKGCVVKTISYRDMQEQYLIRSELECLAVQVLEAKLCHQAKADLERLLLRMRVAATERNLVEIHQTDEAFHGRIVEECGCHKIYTLWKSLEGMNAATYYTMGDKQLMPYDVLERNHRMILDAFFSKDVEEISELIRQHYLIVPKVLNQKEKEECLQ